MRIGIDLGGTKIEGVVMDADSRVLHRQRVATPRDDYAGTLSALMRLVSTLEDAVGLRDLRVGVGTPGAVSPATGRMKNCNSICLNDRPFKQDLEARLGRAIRIANDADCLALSEARDGAGAGATTVFAAILGTGVGGGIAVRGELLRGPNAIAGEWGHNPLPAARDPERPGPRCYCGRQGCVETWLSGPALAADHARYSGDVRSAVEIAQRAGQGDAACRATLMRYAERLGRALASIINVLDPDVIVLGGGASLIRELYEWVPQHWGAHVFSDRVDTRLVPARHGDSSGVRGAAWLWPA
ncbi:MAG TPA: ROK family protein [Solimonas sp.]